MGLYTYVTGSVKITFECTNPERFINGVRGSYAIRDVERLTDREFCIECSFGDEKSLLRTAQKYSVVVKEKKYKGVLPFVYRYRKRAGIFLGLLMGVFVIWFSSLLVWEVRIEGNENISDEDIASRLESLGFKEGVLKHRVDLDRLHIDYLMSDDRISWIAVNFEGTVAHVEVKETVKAPEKLDKDKTVNIVAKRDGVIVRVDALDGGKEVQTGEVVTKGQLLISAFMETRKSGFVLRSARGNVFAKTVHDFEVRVPLKVWKKNYTGNSKKQTTLYILGKRVPLITFGKKNYEYQDTSKEITKLTLFETISFPVRVEIKHKTEYKPEIVTRNENDAKEIAMQKLEEKIEKELVDAKILSKNTDYTLEKNCVVLRCSVECIEDIAKELEFEIRETAQ